MGFIEPESGTLGDIDGCIHLIPGNYKSDEPFNFEGNDEDLLKCNCINGSFVIGVREPILYSFPLDKPPGHKIYKEPRIKHFKTINKSVLSLLIYYIENDDYKPVEFNGETISFTCQLKIYKK